MVFFDLLPLIVNFVYFAYFVHMVKKVRDFFKSQRQDFVEWRLSIVMSLPLLSALAENITNRLWNYFLTPSFFVPTWLFCLNFGVLLLSWSCVHNIIATSIIGFLVYLAD